MNLHAFAAASQPIEVKELAGGGMLYHSPVDGLAAWQQQLGGLLRAARKRLEMSQVAVAKHIRDRVPSNRKAGERVGAQTVQRIERGNGVNTNHVAAYLEAVKLRLSLIQADERLVMALTPHTARAESPQPVETENVTAELAQKADTLNTDHGGREKLAEMFRETLVIALAVDYQLLKDQHGEDVAKAWFNEAHALAHTFGQQSKEGKARAPRSGSHSE